MADSFIQLSPDSTGKRVDTRTAPDGDHREVQVIGSPTTADVAEADATNGLDVDVTRVIPGTSATHLGKAVDSVPGATDTGVAALVVRDDALAALTPADGDYTHLRTDSTGALWVRDTGGAAGGTAMVDDAAFTPAVTNGTPAFGFADETAPDSVDEGDAGALRMTLDRKLLTRVVGATDANRLDVDASGHAQVDIAATSVTVPVSAASLPLPTGASTAALQTQPGVDIGDVTVNNAAGASAVNVQDGGNSLTVDNAALSVVGGGVEATALRVTLASDSTGLVSVDDNGGSLTVDGTVAVSGVVDTELPAAAALADNTANPTAPAVGAFQELWDGATWDRAPGNSTDGALVNLGANNDVTVTGSVTANAGTNLNTSALALEAGGNLAALAASASVLDDWDETNRAAVNTIAGQVGVQGGSGTINALTQRVVLATDQPTVPVSLAAGGTTQYAEDTAHVSGDLVTMAGVVQQTADAAISSDGDRSALQVDASGWLKVNIKAGAGSGGTAMADDAAFTPATTQGTPAFGLADETAPDSVDEGDAGALRMTLDRKLLTRIVGATDANRLDVDGSGHAQVDIAAVSVTVPVSAASLPLPTGASTLAEQQTQTTHLATIAGDTTDIEAAVELIDDTVATLGTSTYTEATTKGLIVGAIRRDADTTLVDTTNEVAPLQVDANGRLKVEAFSGETLPVSLTSTTITGAVDTELPAAAALADNTANPTVPAVGSFLMAFDGTNWDRVQTGAATGGALKVDGSAVTQPVSGTVTANAGTNLNTSALALESGGNLATAVASLSVLDDWDETDRAKVNPIAGQAGVQGASGTVTALTQRVVLATDVGLPAGSSNIGDVDVLTMPVTEVVGDVAADAAVPANPLSIGGRASTAVPTAVSADGDSVYNWLNRLGMQVVSAIPGLGLNADPHTLLSETAQYTSTQTSTVLVTGGASERIIVTSIQIQAGATTAATVQVYFGTGAYSRGTDEALFDGEFAPSATLKPGFYAAPPSGFRAGALGDDILVTTSAGITVTVTVWYYVLGV